MRLENKVALISGGARGMGAVEAKLFAREGAKVVIGDVLEDEGKQTEAEINEAGGQCLFVMLDVTSEENWNQTVAATVARFGKVDILVNNAGIFTLGNVEDTTVEMWDRVMAINGKGVFLGTKAVIPEMRKVGGGSIINLSSVAGLIGSARAAAYGATKGAVRIFTKSTAVQYAKEGIRANSVHPGIIDTPMTVPTILVDDASREAQMERTPLGRLGQSEDVANGVLFLASDESSFMTGSELVIDGGLTAQ
ncbi:MAG TPA: glucose 1-dehydrogenase [Dehalococcoidia bacterium]|mgnify:FL=1|nr:glucose 1-dehydrogenase [Dehalococcoidia bacterium]